MSSGPRPKVFVAHTVRGDAVERLQQVADVTVWPEARPLTPEEFIEQAREAEAIECIGDDVYPAQYRQELAGVLVRRALDSVLADVESHADA